MTKKLTLLVAWFVSGNSLYGSIGIELSPNSWPVGTGGASNFKTWTSATPVGGGSFTVTNIGTDQAIVNIRATPTQKWSLGNSPGLNQFALQWGRTIQQGIEPAWNTITLANTVLSPDLPAGANYSFDLRFQSPSQIDPITLTEKIPR